MSPYARTQAHKGKDTHIDIETGTDTATVEQERYSKGVNNV